jgi:hypothetical protein
MFNRKRRCISCLTIYAFAGAAALTTGANHRTKGIFAVLLIGISAVSGKMLIFALLFT